MTQDTLTTKAHNYYNEQTLMNNIIAKYDYYNDTRSTQRADNRMISYAIYNTNVPGVNDWNCKIQLPEIYELAQTLKSHLVQNLYSHPEAMFDVSGSSFESQKFANKQKAMLVNTFEQMKIGDEMEKIIDSVVETGEVTLFVGWETKTKQIRRALTLKEQLENETDAAFKVEDKVIYDNAKIRFINYEDFVFDSALQKEIKKKFCYLDEDMFGIDQFLQVTAAFAKEFSTK